jgi:hypothetical protein
LRDEWTRLLHRQRQVVQGCNACWDDSYAARRRDRRYKECCQEIL